MKKWLVWGIPVVALIALIGWRYNQQKTANAAQAGKQGGGRNAPIAVEVAKVTSHTIIKTLQSVGTVNSPYKVEISPKTTGRINYLVVREGDPVTKGETLLKIDPSDLQGAVNQALASAAEARSRLAQAGVTQSATGVGISSQIKQQRAGVTSAQANYTQVVRNYESQVASAQASVNSASSGVANATANLNREKSTLKNVQIKYDRTNSLYTQGFIAAQDLDDAKTALEVERGAVAVAQSQVDTANSQLNVQQQNLAIVKRKGLSDIAASKAALSQTKAALETASANRSQVPAYKQNIAALRSAVAAADAQVNQARAKLADTVVRSSINGTVTARKADPGALASPGTPVLEVQFLKWIYVNTAVPVEYSGQVHKGQLASITFDSLPGKVFTGPITNLNPAADPQNRQFSINVRLDNSNMQLRPGMYVRISLEIGRVQASMVVPREAVATGADGSSTVTTVDAESTAHVVTVKLGESDNKVVQILSGVNRGDTVVTLAWTPVRDGQKVIMGGMNGGKGGKGGHKGGRRGGGGGGGAPGGPSAPGGGKPPVGGPPGGP